ncbi:MFS transporter [Variovorax sp. N23]|uniref:MFS transporter n=1 Tax=Variovorax sp. N23 TaxID=2980555 RepID=UPI0021C8D787|nr:MFS transporter [Variovorax sp. N23]MCU4118333.1 MFS transporter [Variovorax sp. N23]
MSPSLPRSFAALTGANLAAQSAEQLSLAAVPLVAVLLLGAGPGEIGLLAAMQTLPFLLLSLPLGWMADRLPRRRLMVGAELLRAASLLGLLAAVATGRLSVGGLAVLGFIGAVGTVAFSVAAPALVPALVPRAALAQANGRLELARSAAYAGGPAIGGALVAWAGASAAFVLATVLSVAAVALLWRLVEPPMAPRAARHPLREVQDGAVFVWRDPMLRPMLLTAVAWNIAWFVLQAAYVPYAIRVLGLGAGVVGVTLGAFGGGMVVGALLAPRLVRAMPFGRAIQLGPVVSVAAAATMVATLFVPSAWVAGLSFFLFGAGPIVWTITSTTLRQSLTPAAMLGRVGALFLTVNAGARPIGAALGGLVGARWGEAACLWLALAGFVLQALLIVRSQVGGLQRLPEAVA